MAGCGKRKWNSYNNKRGRVGGYVCGKRMLCPECSINLKLKVFKKMNKGGEK